MKKILIIAVLLPIILITLFILFAVSVPIVNNITAANVAGDLEDIPLPENTELVESISAAGKFVGNGNGMQYFGAVLIKTDRSLDELNSYYSDYRENEFSLLVEKQESGEIAVIEHGSLVFESELSQDENYYIVYSWGDGIDLFADLDLRGH